MVANPSVCMELLQKKRHILFSGTKLKCLRYHSEGLFGKDVQQYVVPRYGTLECNFYIQRIRHFRNFRSLCTRHGDGM